MPIKVSDDLVLYDVEELSQLLKIQAKSIRSLLKTGKLRGRKMAKRWYTTEADLKAYFLQQEPPEQLPEGSRKAS